MQEVRWSEFWNMIYDFDEGFHAEHQLEDLDPNTPDEDIEAILQEARDLRKQDSIIPFFPTPESTVGADNKHDYTRLTEFLITSFTEQYELGQVYWH